jgi:hypothetical protein
MKKNYSNDELSSLNEELLSDFSIRQLELRLETDPLFFVDFIHEGMMSDETTNCREPMALIVCSGTHNVCTAPEALS